MTGYSYDVIIVTRDRRIIEVVWPPSNWSKTCQNKTRPSMITSYCWFLAINITINPIKWTMLQVLGQSITSLEKSTRIPNLWVTQPSPDNTTLTLIGNLSYGFGYDGVVCYDFLSEQVHNINNCVLIETGDVIWVSAIIFLIGGNVTSKIDSFVRTGRGVMSCIWCNLRSW